MARPKGNKQGSIFFDKSKQKWKVNYYIFDTVSGKEKRVVKSFNKEKEAQDFFQTIQCQRNNDIYIQNNGIPLNLLMRGNVQRKLEREQISEAQFGRTLKTIELIEKCDMSKKKIEEITSNEIQEFLMSIRGYSNSYIKKIYEQFTQAYKIAMDNGYIVRSPMVNVYKPRSTRKDKKVRAMEVEEQRKFTKYLEGKTIEEEPYKNVFLMQMYSGLRIGEALALRSTDINLKSNTISVNKTITTDRKGKPIIKEEMTKTIAGIREIPIPRNIKDSILEQMKIAENNKDKQLFLSQNGAYVDARNVNRILKLRLKELGIEGITSHSLRHTYATRCAEARMDEMALRDLMGHSDIQITKNIYTEALMNFKKAETERVNKYYLDNSFFEEEYLSKEDYSREEDIER